MRHRLLALAGTLLALNLVGCAVGAVGSPAPTTTPGPKGSPKPTATGKPASPSPSPTATPSPAPGVPVPLTSLGAWPVGTKPLRESFRIRSQAQFAQFLAEFPKNPLRSDDVPAIDFATQEVLALAGAPPCGPGKDALYETASDLLHRYEPGEFTDEIRTQCAAAGASLPLYRLVAFPRNERPVRGIKEYAPPAP